MRRIRSSEPGARVLFEAGARKLGKHVTVDVREQIAVDGDVRKLLDEIRKGLGAALVADANPQLARMWTIDPIAGDGDAAASGISCRAKNASEYLDRTFDAREEEVVPPIIAEWSAKAIPENGDGVGTDPNVDTSGGPVPQT